MKSLNFSCNPLPAACLVLLICGGCYTTKAAFNPYSYAPISPSKVWKPPKTVKASVLSDEPPALPDQENPYSLAELIDIALQNNTSTRVTWAQARVAAGQYGQSQKDLFPQLNLQFTYERVRTPAFNTSVIPAASSTPVTLTSTPSLATTSDSLNPVTAQAIYYSDWGPQLQLSYLIFDFGTLRATTEAYRQALYNADWNHNSAIQKLLRMVMDDFYSYVYQRQLLLANVEDVETARLVLEAANTGFDAGVRDVSDVLKAKTQWLQNQTTCAGQEQNVTVASSQLLTDMGLPATTPLKTQDIPGYIPDKNILPPLEELIAVALQHRPDLLAMEASLKAGQEREKAAKRDILPKLKYTLDFGRTYFNGGLNDNYDFDNLFSVNMPIFSGFYHRNAIKTAKANRQKAEEELKNTQLEVIQEVRVARSQVEVAFETSHLAKAYLEVAREQFTVALSKYKQGTNTILDVTSAQSSLANAKAKYIEALKAWYSALAYLSYATGLLSSETTPSLGAHE